MYCVNMGRWADSIIGPFDTEKDAVRYIDGLSWRGEEPKVVQVAPPSLREFTVELYVGGVSLTAVRAATTPQCAVVEVAKALNLVFNYGEGRNTLGYRANGVRYEVDRDMKVERE